MAIEIRQESPDVLAEYATISIAFWVRSRLLGTELKEEAIDRAYLKDYDAAGESPLSWGKTWDLNRCAIFTARDCGPLIGGAMVAINPGDDAATLVDLRVTPEHRRVGIGSMLFDRAVLWTREQKLPVMRIETQNTNVAGCRFYARCGAKLCGRYPGVYAHFPDEVMLIWEIDVR